jgi:hypothetical protein
MNWEAIGAIGELIGAVVVVVSLVYLAAQVRQDTEQARLSSVQAVTFQNSESLGRHWLWSPAAR